jgi:hypothetical protein
MAMSDKTIWFLKDNWFHLASIIVAASLGYALLQELARRVDVLEKSGSQPLRERIQALESSVFFSEKRLLSIELDARQTANVMSDFKADLRFVVEWVKEQKRNAK